MSECQCYDFACPACKAGVDEKCKNYRGVGCGPHRERKRLVQIATLAVRWRAPRVKLMAERQERGRTLWDDIPAPDLS